MAPRRPPGGGALPAWPFSFRLMDAALVAVLVLVMVSRLDGVGVDGGGGVDGDVDFAVNPSADPDDDDEYSSATAPLEKSSCSACRVREARNQSLETIKLKILSKLNLRQAPNMTGRALPDLSELSELLERDRDRDRSSSMLGDDPAAFHADVADDEDDYSARTQRVIAFAQPREFALPLHTWCSLPPNDRNQFNPPVSLPTGHFSSFSAPNTTNRYLNRFLTDEYSQKIFETTKHFAQLLKKLKCDLPRGNVAS